MKCPHCSFENLDDAKFCAECWRKQIVACPKCGNSNSPGYKFCSECGPNLDEPAKPQNYSAPHSYTSKHLVNKVLNAQSALEGDEN